MRLLQFQDAGGFSLVEFYGRDIPPYAILSHTWTGDEVTFDDIHSGKGKEREGYRKLTFCREQALKSGLSYVWIDTCCIDKSSSAEIQEAINFMFRLYQNAAKCYALLSDITFSGFTKNRHTFQNARWFTRGWTLQELLAPSSVLFFSAEGELLGDRNSLMYAIHKATGIPSSALQGTPLSEFSIEDRVSWVESRYTTRPEDMAYCLLGIFSVYMPLIYGEGRENAFKRLIRAIQESDIQAETCKNYLQDMLNSMPGPYPSSSSHCVILDTDSDDDDSDVASLIFSDGGASKSSTTSADVNPIQTSGIREVSIALLNQKDLEVLYTTIVRKLDPRKARSHIRGFLKEYGLNLLTEAGQSNLHGQAAKFIQELAGRIADEIRFRLAPPDDYVLPVDTTPAKKDLEGWLSSLQPQSKTQIPEAKVENLFEGVDSDDEFDADRQFPNIKLVEDFLVHSEAFSILVQAMKSWLKNGDGRDKKNKTPKIEIPGNLGTAADSHQTHAPESSLPNAHEIDSSFGNLAAGGAAKEVVQGMAMEPETNETTTELILERALSTGQSNVTESLDPQPQHNVPRETRARPPTLRKYRNVSDLVSGLVDYWGISFFLHDIFEVFVPRVPPGYKRLRWRCTCNTVLWGDFPANDEHALNQLKRELAWWENVQFHPTPSYRTSASLPSGGHGAVQHELVESSAFSAEIPTAQSASPSSQMSQNTSNASGLNAPHVVDIRVSPKYFEVCVNIANNDVAHHEIDISNVDSDSDLFARIWDKYSSDRGILRRLFLRPRDVHFVMFSLNRHTKYGTGIHMKPDEFPPQPELDERRYHYLCPKIRMPANTFLHYLHRARWNVWGEHSGNVWLKRLPKKLEEGVLATLQQNTAMAQQNYPADPDLVFGWGVHILDGPNHIVLMTLLFIGVAVSSVVSGLVVWLGETQEQGFGVGNFLLAIFASLMAALYFKFQDHY